MQAAFKEEAAGGKCSWQAGGYWLCTNDGIFCGRDTLVVQVWRQSPGLQSPPGNFFHEGVLNGKEWPLSRRNHPALLNNGKEDCSRLS